MSRQPLPSCSYRVPKIESHKESVEHFGDLLLRKEMYSPRNNKFLMISRHRNDFFSLSINCLVEAFKRPLRILHFSKDIGIMQWGWNGWHILHLKSIGLIKVHALPGRALKPQFSSFFFILPLSLWSIESHKLYSIHCYVMAKSWPCQSQVRLKSWLSHVQVFG